MHRPGTHGQLRLANASLVVLKDTRNDVSFISVHIYNQYRSQEGGSRKRIAAPDNSIATTTGSTSMQLPSPSTFFRRRLIKVCIQCSHEGLIGCFLATSCLLYKYA